MRTTTPRKVIQLARVKTDTVYSAHTSDSEALLLLNQSYLQLYGMMIQMEEALFIKTSQLTVTAGVAPIPDDCQKIRCVYYKIGDQEVVLERRSLRDKDFFESMVSTVARPSSYCIEANNITFAPKQQAGELWLKYIPHPSELSALDDQIQLVANEDQYLIARMCRDIAKREESDTVPWETEMVSALGAISSLITPRDDGSLPQVKDVYNQYNRNFRNQVRRGPYR
jgi:hypothetical protein